MPVQQPQQRPVDGGLGTARFLDDPRRGSVEVFELIPQLSTMAAERAIRTTVTLHHELDLGKHNGPVGLAYDVRRVLDKLYVVSAAVEGVRLSDLLDALQAGTVKVSDEALVDLVAAITRAVATLHERPAAGAHGALSPYHIVVTRDGGVALTHAVFAAALQSLNWSRHQWWWQCGFTMPPSASLPRFDHRSDVVQLGAVALAVLLRRRLAVDEYTALHELALQATVNRRALESGLREWLQQALHLHPRLTFSSASHASSQLSLILSDGGGARPVLRSRAIIRNVMTALPAGRR